MSGVSRRNFLRAGAAVGLAAAATPAVGTVAAQESPTQTFDGWLDGVDNYDGVVDARGESTVTVDVGTQANGGAFGFGPAAVQVDPGTTVRWVWTGEGGVHNVAADDGSFASEFLSDEDETFEYVADAEGVVRYACEPHAAMGMKGVVVVGEVPGVEASAAAESTGPDPAAVYGDWFDDVDNFAGTVDRRGEEVVTVEVGAAGNGGAFGFEPAAVQVDPGTTVRWLWSGEGGFHNVVASDGAFESEMSGDDGHVFEHVVEGRGVATYACEPHVAMGMKGALLVGDAATAGGPASLQLTGTHLLGGGLVAAAFSPIALWVFMLLHGTNDGAVGSGRTYYPDTTARGWDDTPSDESRSV
ncbi:halocyanin domain-containing protein [Halogranum amylolyticum]|uniref:Halocyanin domain-containing protein n=1 Tax=Halogranum amylolyticum TaxID=660520 RepID=A0A1H8P7E5_9EURY|nr:halocyanin domain-containing protein [Halogranum amylolyticum]SEO37845.1 halocyanin domain-containing protein [Halogranum amylolyticum]